MLKQLLIAGMALLFVVVVVCLIGCQKIIRSSGQDEFSFTTITLDRNGAETSRKTGQANYFSVDLGNGVTLDMVEIPGGSFMMGAPETKADSYAAELPRHRVKVP